MPTYRLTLEYEGTRYRGWQEQQNARTVAGELRAAVEKVAGSVAEIGGSGRTDAGVHAMHQTAHVRADRLVLFCFVASHLLWRMVRRLVGTLVRVGVGKLTVEEFAAMIGGTVAIQGDEGPAKWTAPPSGLFLERVLYPGDPPLPAIAP